MISMVGQRAHGFGNSILMDFALLRMRIRPPVPEWSQIEIWSVWERNTESVRDKYISTNLWQIQSLVVRNAIWRTNAVMLVWTEIPRLLQSTVQMRAEIYKYKYTNTITQIQIQTQIQIRSDDGGRTILSEIKFWWILAFTESESDPPFRSYASLTILSRGPVVWLVASQQMKNWKNLNFW